MKSLGITRKIDELGRIVIPIETRRILNINEKDALEIFIDGENIILRKYQPGCIVCGSLDNLKEYNAKHICPECYSKFA